MGDFLGPIAITDPPVLTTKFPLRGDYGSGADLTPPIAIHVFDQPGLKTEQRYLLGDGARRFRIRKDHLSCHEYDDLKAHWQQAQGGYASFPYDHWGPAGLETVTARYENPNLAFDHLVGLVTGDPGLTLLEVPTVTPSYAPSTVVTRFPDSALTTALTSQLQQLVPLIVIQPRDGSTPLYLSDRRCLVTVPGQAEQVYLPRLLSWSGISQTLGEASDSASFTFGNADDAFTKLTNQVNLWRAAIQFALLHVNSNYLINLWGGTARAWVIDSSGQFQLPASDGVFELSIGYPARTLGRSCWKVYKGRFCPSTSALPDCPKDYDSCVARGVEKSFGGVVALPQTVHIKDNSTGVFGFGRSSITSVSIAEESVYQRPVQEVYTDTPMLVTCDVADGRDESEFYSALGIVGEGPIGGYAQNLLLHTLDGQPPHDPYFGGGWRGILGNDPAAYLDYFGLDQAPWIQVIKGKVPTAASLPSSGNTVHDGWITQDTQHLWGWDGSSWADTGRVTWAGGLAFAEIRRTDAKGLQLSKVSDRAMNVTVDTGIAGWYWTAPGARVYTGSDPDPKKRGLSNPVWVAVNVYLRALGLRVIPANAGAVPVAEMEQYFDVAQAIKAAAICEVPVDKLVGTGTERQFPFRGALKEKKPLKDWLTEILNCCLGYYTFVAGKLWIGIRDDSGVLAGNAFTRDSILYKSLQASPLTPAFNYLVGQFGDEEFNWAMNSVTIYDIEHAAFAGNNASPQYLQSTMNFVGVSNKSQCARIITTRLREEIGGVGLAEQMAARNLKFQTTLLALRTMAGDIISMDDPSLPNGRIEGRVQSWVLNPDYSIDIQTSCTTDSMYDLDFEGGPKPVDVPADPVIPELLPSPTGLAWMPNHQAPFAGDPLYPDLEERTFDLWQDYAITKDGKWEPAIWVAGEQVVNRFVTPQVQPRIVGVTLVAGGALAGPMVVYAAVTQHGAAAGRGAAPKTGPALVAHGGAAGSAGATTPGVNTTGATLLVCALTSYIGGTSDGLTDSLGNTWIPLTSYVQPSKARCTLYYCSPGSKVGAGHTFTSAAQFCTIEIAAFSGVDAAAPFVSGSDQGAVGAFPIQTGSITATAGDLVVSALGAEQGTAYAVDSGLSITDSFDYTPGTYFGGALAYLVATATGAINPSWSATGDSGGPVAIACFKATSGVTPPPSGGDEVYTVPSKLVAVYIPEGVTGQALTLDMAPAAGSWTDWDLYVGTDPRRIAWQSSATAPLPASYTFPGPIHPMTRELPEAAARRVRITAKHVWHAGVAGVTITGVTAPNILQCNDFEGSTDDWIGRIVSALADASDGSAPLWNFTVTHFNSATGELTVTPDCVRTSSADSVEVGDVLVVRSIGAAADVDWVEDPRWDNFVTFHQFGVHGFTPDEEKGRLVRVLRGKGAGQLRQCTGNTDIRLYVHPNWDVIPDATSVIIVEEASYPASTDTSDFDVPRPGVTFAQRLRLENLADEVALVTGFLVDDQGQITDEQFAVHREIYVFGEPPHVRDIGPEPNDPDTGEAWLMRTTDQTLRADTSANDVNIQLLPLAAYAGRTLYVVNDNGPFDALVSSAVGEPMFDGETSVTVGPLVTTRLTAG